MGKTVGFYGGKFTPLHNGHVYAMLMASVMVDELHVIVCYDEDSEKNELHKDSLAPYFSYQIRARWWKEITKHMPHVQVHTVYNPNTMNIKDWQIGAEEIKRVIGKPISHVFSSDSSYDVFFETLYPEANHIVLDEKRERFPISSTVIRRDGVFAHWDMIPKAVQRYFVKKVVVIGSESCGKSTLVKNLALIYGTNYAEEQGRTYYEELNDYDYFSDEDLIRIAYRQKYFEEKAVYQSNKLLFCDTEATVTRRFYNEYLGKDHDLLREIAIQQHYDLWLFLEDDVSFVDDGTRGYVGDRTYSSQLLKRLLSEQNISYTILQGSYEERLKKAIIEIDKLLI
ncbi:AAA family ATPase [Bacillus sp. AGMB 02131]|uniref:AAA family ATPase n=1 Tax=Peribacillus faecalis TaxID=2772559 RepID=A0A927CWN5_9BACI|nr:AAA family ATPase [Peribacillus faecalis]MBD3108446.1 AAA family ATPase [Peribacillus faecalis]